MGKGREEGEGAGMERRGERVGERGGGRMEGEGGRDRNRCKNRVRQKSEQTQWWGWPPTVVPDYVTLTLDAPSCCSQQTALHRIALPAHA